MMKRRLFNEISQFSLTYKDNEDVWFLGENYSLLFQVSLVDCSIKKIIRIKDEKFMQFRRYWRLLKIRSRVILIPINSTKITIYHTDRDKFSFIYLDEPTVNCMNCIEKEQKLYLISDTEIIVIDVEKERVEEYIPVPANGKVNSMVALLDGEHIFIPLVFQAAVIDFYIPERNFSYTYLDCGANGFVAGVSDGEKIWLAGDSGNIICWSYISGELIIYDQVPEEFESFNYDKQGNFVKWGSGWRPGVCFKFWYDCFLLDDRVWFIPFLSDSLLYIDKRNHRLCKFTLDHERETEFSMKNRPSRKFMFIGIQQERYIKVYSMKRNLIYSIDSVTLLYTEETFLINNIDMMGIEKEYFTVLFEKGIHESIIEGRNISVGELVYLVEGNGAQFHDDTRNESIGTQIYHML